MRTGKPSLFFSGYHYRIHGKNSKFIKLGFMLKTKEVSAKANWKLIYSMKWFVKRTTIGSNTNWNRGSSKRE